MKQHLPKLQDLNAAIRAKEAEIAALVLPLNREVESLVASRYAHIQAVLSEAAGYRPGDVVKVRGHVALRGTSGLFSVVSFEATGATRTALGTEPTLPDSLDEISLRLANVRADGSVGSQITFAPLRDVFRP